MSMTYEETDDERTSEELDFTTWLHEQARVRVWSPDDADLLPDEDAEDDDE